MPGGKLEAEEQPEESIKRHVDNDTGLSILSVKLLDVLAFPNSEEMTGQNIVIIYEVDIADPRKKILLGRSYNDSLWVEKNNLQQLELRESTKIVLEVIPVNNLIDKMVAKRNHNDDKITSDENHFIIYTDGGSRGNPGPSSAGYVIYGSKGSVIDKGGMYIGVTTNNQAEYEAVRFGLERARELGADSIEFRLDSMLVVNQMNGINKVRNRELLPINNLVRNLVSDFKKVTFVHVPRELNQVADAMVNLTLDKHKPHPL